MLGLCVFGKLNSVGGVGWYFISQVQDLFSIMSSLDINTVYTNKPVTKCLKLLGNHIIQSILLYLYKIIQRYKLITNHCFFSLNKIFYN